MKIRVSVVLLSVFALLCVLPAPGSGQEASPETSPEWEFEITPYLWLAGITGQARIGEKESEEVEVSFSDLFDKLHGAFMASFDVRRGRWGAGLDGMYFNLQETAQTGGPAEAQVDAKVVQEVLTGTVLYRVVEDEAWAVDLLGGARYLGISLDATGVGGFLDGRTVGADEGWVDAILGARGVYSFTDRWSASARLDVGTGGSDHSWQGMLGVGFRFSGTLNGRLVYRHLAYDFNKETAAFDLALGGPALGLGIRF